MIESHEPPNVVKLIEVIYCCSTKGKGVEGDPERLVHRYYDKDGTILAVHDPHFGDVESLMHPELHEGHNARVQGHLWSSEAAE